MAIEFIPAAVVRDLTRRIEEARCAAVEPEQASRDDAPFWERVFEANAAAVLGSLSRVHLPPESAVRYRFYGRRGGDLLVRPFVAGRNTELDVVRSFIDWHPPPDSVAPGQSGPTRDVELLYRHFRFELSPAGYFEYWVAMQELWASARWVHSRLVADADHFTELTSRGEWRVHHTPERCEPAVMMDGIAGAQLAVMVYCPLDRESVSLQQIRIGPEQDIAVTDILTVADGPRGYTMR